MATTTAAGPLAVAETERIAALLAEVMPQAARRAPPPADKPAETAVGRVSVRELLKQVNWRNEPPGGTAAEEPAVIPAAAVEPGPLPAPFGVLTAAELFGLVNWRNRPDEARPLPVIKPPPPPGAEFTVEAMLTTFGWE